MSFSADIGSNFREHEVLTDVLMKIPRRHQRGLFSSDIEWTCVDATGHWLAIGTNVGFVYVYNRLSDCVDYTFTVPSQHVSGKISKVKLKESVELLTALGTESGAVSIFVANPKTYRSLSQLHTYQIDDIHHSQVTFLEWSPNGMRLLSADVDGVVACTDIDYNKEECRSYVLCKEPYPVVQLSYFRQYVLISTRFRTVICHVSKPWHVTQVGQKDRKVCGNFGATFVHSTPVTSPENAFAYVARPGLRLWKADLNGVVSETIIFQRPETSPMHPHHLSSTPRSDGVERSGDDSQYSSPRNGELGLLLPFSNERFISISDTVLFLLDLEKSRTIVWSYSCSVVDVAVANDEVFILKQCSSKNDVPLLRFAQEPLSSWVSGKFSSSSRLPPALFSGTSPASQRGNKEDVGKTSSSSLSAKVFGLLANIGEQYTSPHVEEGVLPTNLNARQYDGRDDYVTEIGLEAGPEIDTAAAAGFSGSKGNVSAISDIPVVRLDPTEVVAVQVVASSSTPSSSSVTVTECVEPVKKIVDEDIVFSSAVVKKKVKKTACKTQGFAREKSPIAGVDWSTSMVTSSCDVDKADCSSDVRESFGAPEVVANNNTQMVTKDLKSNVDSADDNKPVCGLNESSCEESANVDIRAGLEAAGDASRWRDVEVKGVGKSLHEKDETSLREERTADVLLSDVLPLFTNIERSDSRSETDRIIGAECDAVAAAVQSDVQHGSTSVCAAASAEVRTSSDSQRSPERRRSSGTIQDELKASTRNFTSQSLAGESRCDFAFSAAVDDDDASGGFEASSSRDLFRSRSCVTTSLKPMIGSDKIHGEVLTGRGDFSSSGGGGGGGGAPRQIIAYAATLTSPSDDFHSIYAGTGDYAVQGCRGGSEAVPAPKAPPRVYLPTSDAWVEISGPPRASLPLQSLAASRHTLWCVDRGCNLHHAVLGEPGLQWVAVEQQPAQRIASSPSGHIVWILHNGSAYVAVGKLSAKCPAGSEWREVARDVAFVAVDDNVAWYVKNNGDVMMQKGLARDRPSFRSIKVPSDCSMSIIACRNSVVWSLNEHQKMMVRLGITNDVEEGIEWCSLDGFGSNLVVSSLNIDAERQVVWVVDESSRIWFTNGVNWEHPKGSGLWWQVSTTGFIMPPVSAPPAYSSVRSVTTNLSQKLASSGPAVTPHLSGGVVVTSNGKLGVCVSLACQQTLVACRSAISGHRWDVATPVGMLSTTKWRHVSVTSIYDVATHNSCDMIWLQQQSGAAVFLQTVASSCTESSDDAAGQVSRIVEIESPSESTLASLAQTFVALCATSDALWGLLPTGQLFTRSGINSHCPTGVEWVDVNLAQIGNQVKLVHVAVGLNNVWAVDNRGHVYLRVGVRQPVDQRVCPAWAQVPSDSPGSVQAQRRNSWSGKSGQSNASAVCSLTAIGTQIVRIYAGPNDWMLWAIDNKQNLFVREGITDAVPVGLRWTSVAGLRVETLCVSNQFVYVLSLSHECYVRHGITIDCPDGEYWTVIPGKFSAISVSPYDSLWSIDLQGQLQRHSLFAIKRCGSHTDIVGKAAASCDVSVDADWEVV